MTSESYIKYLVNGREVYIASWMYGMPMDWWDIYFDRMDGFAISLRSGNA